MIALPGYTEFEPISETLNSMVYRACKTETRESVVIKVLKVENPSPSEVARFKHEYELIRKLDMDGVVRVLDIIAAEGRFALVLEDFSAVSLKEYLQASLPLDLFLGMAARLADILNQLHARNITHRDIKPGNILYNPETDLLKLTDFGIAAELTGIHEEVYNPQVIQGTLVYMSPEQTGRMNRGVDYRTDLYSLGITFYEMLTGGVPFAGSDPMEIIHSHIARMPLPPEKLNPAIPKVLSEIVMRLLAKNAEERYQSSAGLMTDLWECRQRMTATGQIAPFEIGRRDISPKFNIPQVLVGREEERETLFETFEQASAGEAKVMLVTGEPGIGKSALVNEIHKPMVGKRGYFLSGKYDLLRRNVPYSAIIQAIQGLAHQLLAESAERIATWKQKLLAALGPNGRIITDIMPEVELLIGKQPDIPELVSEEAQNRFKLVLKNFVRVFADPDHPLVLFLDDLQWADPASLELIQTLTMDRDLRFFFLIGAYRDNEVAAHHPLMLAVDAMLAAEVDFTQLELNALDQKSVNRLLANFLRCEAALSEPLAAIVFEKTLGNPFFVNQFLKRLYEGRYLVLDPSVGWQWDIAAIQKMQVTDNVVEFMAEKLRDLPPDPLTMLKIGACIGNRFDAENLAAISDKSIDAVLYTIDALLQEGLVLYKNGLYRFQHDRIHEAAYSLLSAEERERLHYRIGHLRLAHTPPDALHAKVFYIVDQLNKARALLQSEAERIRVSELNLMAGVKAKDSTAYGAAVAYLQSGIDLLPEGSWQANYRHTYALYMQQMECQYLARNADEAERLFEILLAYATNKSDQAKAYNTMVILYTNLRSAREAAAIGIKGLNLLGIRVSANTGIASVLRELVQVKLRLLRVPVEKVIHQPPMRDEYCINCMELLVNTGTPAFFINPFLYATLVLKGTNLCLKHGNSPDAAVAFMALATIVQVAQGDYRLGYRIGEMALSLNDHLGNKKMAGMVLHIFAFFIQHWKKHARCDLATFRQVYQLSIESGNYVYMGYSISSVLDVRLMVGDRLEDILEEAERYKELMNRVKDPFIAARIKENVQLARTLMGRTQDRFCLSGPDFDEEAHLATLRRENNTYGLCYTLLYKVKLFYLFGDFAQARRTAAELDKHINVHIGSLLISEHYFYYSLVLTALLAEKHTDGKSKIRRIIRRNQRKMAKWAQLCPENFRHKYDLVEAERQAAQGRLLEALRRYHAAIRGAHENGYTNEEALACELTALFYQRYDALEEARTFMQRAHRCYGFWGAAAKQHDIEQRHAALAPDARNYTATDTGGHHGSTQTTSRQLDLSTVMKVSQAISSEIMLDRLLRKTMHLSL
ncbi:MAG: serine/threonine-protein kinase PknK, partial [Desulfatitalea sp.]